MAGHGVPARQSRAAPRRESIASGALRIAIAGAFAALAAFAVQPARALADGAFPDSFALFAPEDQPGRIVLGTNFGLIRSEDDGASWTYVCEAAIAPNPSIYQLGPPPQHLIFGVAFSALAVSRDGACTFEHAGGFTNTEVDDVFPDPSDPMHVLALGRPRTATGASTLYESTDGALSFPTHLSSVPLTDTLQSLEIARSDPHRVYMTSWIDFPPHPYVLTSTDAARSFRTIDAMPAFGSHIALIAQVHPTDPERIYFRVFATGEGSDSLGISEDGGRTGRIAVALDGKMSAFLRRSDGALIAGVNMGGDAQISTDEGRTFTKWEHAPHIKGLAERAGAIYAATDNAIDGYAVAVTRDQGRTWTPLLRFEDISVVAACTQFQPQCEASIANVKATIATVTPPPDAGFAPDAMEMMPPPSTDTRSGCNCAAAGDAAVPGSVLAALALLAYARGRKRSS